MANAHDRSPAMAPCAAEVLERQCREPGSGDHRQVTGRERRPRVAILRLLMSLVSQGRAVAGSNSPAPRSMMICSIRPRSATQMRSISCSHPSGPYLAYAPVRLRSAATGNFVFE